ncbi:MAG: hypothetical protein AB7F43_09885 [Bacteriovoracia bacterium]
MDFLDGIGPPGDRVYLDKVEAAKKVTIPKVRISRANFVRDEKEFASVSLEQFQAKTKAISDKALELRDDASIVAQEAARVAGDGQIIFTKSEHLELLRQQIALLESDGFKALKGKQRENALLSAGFTVQDTHNLPSVTNLKSQLSFYKSLPDYHDQLGLVSALKQRAEILYERASFFQAKARLRDELALETLIGSKPTEGTMVLGLDKKQQLAAFSLKKVTPNSSFIEGEQGFFKFEGVLSAGKVTPGKGIDTGILSTDDLLTGKEAFVDLPWGKHRTNRVRATIGRASVRNGVVYVELRNLRPTEGSIFTAGEIGKEVTVRLDQISDRISLVSEFRKKNTQKLAQAAAEGVKARSEVVASIKQPVLLSEKDLKTKTIDEIRHHFLNEFKFYKEQEIRFNDILTLKRNSISELEQEILLELPRKFSSDDFEEKKRAINYLVSLASDSPEQLDQSLLKLVSSKLAPSGASDREALANKLVDLASERRSLEKLILERDNAFKQAAIRQDVILRWITGKEKLSPGDRIIIINEGRGYDFALSNFKGNEVGSFAPEDSLITYDGFINGRFTKWDSRSKKDKVVEALFPIDDLLKSRNSVLETRIANAQAKTVQLETRSRIYKSGKYVLGPVTISSSGKPSVKVYEVLGRSKRGPARNLPLDMIKGLRVL